MLRPKPGKTASWLPNQVHCGVDTSDPNPEAWSAFGEHADKVLLPGAKQPRASKPNPQEK